MKDDKLYLLHISDCIARIERYTSEGKDAFFADTKTQDAVLRNLQTLAESTQRLSSNLKVSHPEVDWKRMAGFRNIVVHNYLGIDFNRVWNIVEHELPNLKRSVEEMLRELEGET